MLGWRACPPAQLITWLPPAADHSVPLRRPTSQLALESLELLEPSASLKSLELLESRGSQTPPLKPLKRLELRKPLAPLEPLEPPPGRESLRSIVETFGLQVPYGLGEGNDHTFHA